MPGPRELGALREKSSAGSPAPSAVRNAALTRPRLASGQLFGAGTLPTISQVTTPRPICGHSGWAPSGQIWPHVAAWAVVRGPEWAGCGPGDLQGRWAAAGAGRGRLAAPGADHRHPRRFRWRPTPRPGVYPAAFHRHWGLPGPLGWCGHGPGMFGGARVGPAPLLPHSPPFQWRGLSCVASQTPSPPSCEDHATKPRHWNWSWPLSQR